MAGALITILTDFGSHDPYVGAMKGVILGINPRVQLIDLSHEVPPQAIREGAFILGAAYRYFPTGTIHLAVVDPGVGGGRRPIAVEAGGHLFVGPDNGIFTFPLMEDPSARVRHLTASEYFLPEVSPTFHGRDLFAPVAGHLSLGVSAAEMGPLIADPVVLAVPSPTVEEGSLRGEVLRVDRFGNLVTNIPGAVIPRGVAPEKLRIEVQGRTIVGLSRAYSQAPQGTLIALWGSLGRLEISVCSGSAEQELGAGVGTAVRVRW